MTDPVQAKRKGLSRLYHATINSLYGLRYTWGEAAFRQEVMLGSVLVVVACVTDVTRLERLALIASVLLVLIVEVLNTAIEVAIDRISFDRHDLSKRAKDMGSAAVFLALALAALCWATVFLPPL